MPRYTIDNQPRAVDFECNNDLLLRTLQNAKNLLMTRKGEVPYDRNRGLDPALFDLPMDELQARLIPELDRVMNWDPDVEVVDASCRMAPGGDAILTVTIDVGIDE